MFVNKLPRYEILSPDAVETLERGWKRIVSELGVEFLLPEAVELFAAQGMRTEGDCVWLAEAHLGRETASYASRLVTVWQRAVYGREEIQTAAVHDLCDGFSATLDGSPQAAMGGTAP